MDSIVNKAVVIAVGIFVTIAITSGILLSINEMKKVYQQVYQTDTSITSRFSEFDTFDGTVKTGLEVANAVNKYGSMVEITNLGYSTGEKTYGQWMSEVENRSNNFYKSTYNSSLVRDDTGRVTKIKFSLAKL